MDVPMGKVTSAWLPIVMSLAALMLVSVQIITVGFTPARDEGVLAHLWQLLMVAQLPVIAFFAYRWLRRVPWRAATVLVCQALAAATALIPVRLLGW